MNTEQIFKTYWSNQHIYNLEVNRMIQEGWRVAIMAVEPAPTSGEQTGLFVVYERPTRYSV